MNYKDINEYDLKKYGIEFNSNSIASSILVYTRICEMLYPVLANPDGITVVDKHDKEHPLFVQYIYHRGGVSFPISCLLEEDPATAVRNFVVNDDKYNVGNKDYLRTENLKISRLKHIEELEKFIEHLKEHINE